MSGDRERLAAALRPEFAGPSHLPTCSELADALLPVVDRIANERAAAELRALRTAIRENEDAATDAALEGVGFTLRVLASRADALGGADWDANTARYELQRQVEAVRALADEMDREDPQVSTRHIARRIRQALSLTSRMTVRNSDGTGFTT